MSQGKYNLKEKTRQHLQDYIAKNIQSYLPSERELMKSLGVSRATVRNALTAMVCDGIISPVHGKGYLILGEAAGKKKNSMAGLIVRRNYELFEQELFNEMGDYLKKLNIRMIYMSLESDEELFPSRLASFMNEIDLAVFSGGIIDSVPIYDAIKPHLDRCVILGNVCNKLYPVKYVNLDVTDGCYKLTRHLLRLGHRNIAFAGLLKDQPRINGIRKAFEKSNLNFGNESLFETTRSDRYHGFKAAAEVFSDGGKFSAVICHNDKVALGFMEYCLMRGIKIPAQVALCGFDDIEDAKNFPIPLTSIQPDRLGMVKRVTELISESTGTDNIRNIIKVKLQIRESTGVSL